MRSVAIGPVLGRPLDRSAIGSPRDFRLAYLNALRRRQDEIAAEQDRGLALGRKAVPRHAKCFAALSAANRSPTPGGSAGVPAPTDAGSERTGEGLR